MIPFCSFRLYAAARLGRRLGQRWHEGDFSAVHQQRDDHNAVNDHLRTNFICCSPYRRPETDVPLDIPDAFRVSEAFCRI